jgi:hypothetical protein
MKLYNFCKLILVGVSFAFLFGCATPANHTEMTVKSNEYSAKKKNSAFVRNVTLDKVAGGTKTNPLWTSQVDNKGFSNAVTASLSNMEYYNADLEKARYRLTATLEELKQPMIGIDLKVVCTAKYALYDNKLKKTVFEKTLTTPYVASFSSSLYAPTRLKLANEGAVKENIKQLLVELDTL